MLRGVTAPRIHVYPADKGGCGFYRVIWPAEALQAQGADVEVIFPEDGERQQVMTTMWSGDDGSRVLLDARAPDCDVIVLQRPLTDVLAQAIPRLQAQGRKVVVEIDDDFEAISPRNVSWRAVQPQLSPRRNWRHLRTACEQADLVVVSTPALAAVYGRHGRVAVVPNRVPAWYLRVRPEPHDGVRVGWSGSIETHPDDLQVTRGAIARAMRGTEATMHVVGTGKGVQRALGLASPPAACGWQPLGEYPHRMAEVDVGIVPLELTRFNEAKSWLKGLEFAALGVPFVASPTGPYCELVAAGAGLLADTPKAWQRLVRRLVERPDERAELAEAGRQAAGTLTIEGGCGRWLDAWGSVVNTRASSSVA